VDSPQQRAEIIRDFKIARAQDVLWEAKRAKARAQKMHERLANSQSAFDRLEQNWRKSAGEFVTVQRGRHRLERWLNDWIWPAGLVLFGLASVTLAVVSLIK
jgi:hypothetical protein